MPVEIRELIIRAVTTAESEDSETVSQRSEPLAEQDAIVQECVRQVLKILKQTKER